MSIQTETADVYALLNDLTPWINGHYVVNEETDNMIEVKITNGTVADKRWIAENILRSDHMDWQIEKIGQYHANGFSITLTKEWI